jgi:hypothetical protein
MARTLTKKDDRLPAIAVLQRILVIGLDIPAKLVYGWKHIYMGLLWSIKERAEREAQYIVPSWS